MNRPPSSLTWHRIVLWTALVLFAAWFLTPLYVMIVTSLKDMDQIRAGSLMSLPTSPGFASWGKAWNQACTGTDCGGLKPFFLNSVVDGMPASTCITIRPTMELAMPK